MSNSQKTLNKVLIIFVLFQSFLPAQQRFVGSVKGTFDFDSDGLSEFLSLEKSDSSAGHSTLCMFYEIDELGEHTLLWTYDSNTPIRDAAIADMDGDSSPEIVVLSRTTLAEGSEPWLRIFPWTEGVPSSQPSATWSGAASRPTNLAIVDLDNNGSDEIAIGMGSPGRGITLLTLGYNGSLETQQTLEAGTLSNGLGFLLVSPSDYNNDGLTDLVAVSQEPQELRIQFFLNDGGELLIDQSISENTQGYSTGGGIIPTAISIVNTDFDDTEEILLPYKSGDALLVELSPGDTELRKMEQPSINLFTLPDTGMKPVDINEILLARAETGVTQLRARKIQLHAIQPYSETTLSKEEAPVPGGKVRKLQLQAVEETTVQADEEVSVEPVTTELPREPEDTPADLGKVRDLQLRSAEKEEDKTFAAATESEAEDVELRKVRKLTLASVKKEEVLEILPEDILPDGESVTDTLYVGEDVSWPVLKEATQQLRGFFPDYLPNGAKFDPAERVIAWTPKENQLGIRKMSYTVSFIIRDKVEVEEIRGQSVTARSREAEETVVLYFYITHQDNESGDSKQ